MLIVNLSPKYYVDVESTTDAVRPVYGPDMQRI